MAAVAKSWLVMQCPKCVCRRIFVVRDGWVMACSECGTTIALDKTGVIKD